MSKPYEILTGDCFSLAKTLPRQSIQCIVTSPPYWGLRDYETEPRVWDGTKGCHHRWRHVTSRKRGHPGDRSTLAGTQTAEHSKSAVQRGAFCRRCGAWRGSFGLEPTPDLYVRHLVQLFRRLRRALRDDGVVWLNLGDSYNAAGREGHGTRVGYKQGTNRASAVGADRARPTAPDLKPKDLVGIPWRVAFALQAAGWYLRSDVIWHKPNPMPEAVTDRPTKAHEYLFLLSKRQHYFYDADAIKEASTGQTGAAAGFIRKTGTKSEIIPHQAAAQHRNERVDSHDVGTRNKRSVWTISTKPFKEAHFAVFPEALVEPCIKAGTSERGCCPKCGTPWTRVTQSQYRVHKKWYGEKNLRPRHSRGTAGCSYREVVATTTLRWQANCKCGRTREPVPCTVLDPFNGSGTTGAVAVKLHRRYVGIELNPAYVVLAARRLRRARRTPQAQLAPLFAR